MKSTLLVFVCILYCCQGAAVSKDVVIDGKSESLPPVTVVTTESTKTKEPAKADSIGPIPTPTHAPSNITTVTPSPTTTNGTTVTPTTPTTKVTTVTPAPSTTNGTTVTPPTPTTKVTTVTPAPSTTNGTTVTPPTPTTKVTTVTPPPSPTKPTTAPVTSTTVVPPSNRGFDGPSFIGGIVLASGLMAIGFVALKFYRARTELNYHTL